MKTITKKTSSTLVALFAAAAMSAPVPVAHAMGEGQIAGGNIYRIRNVTNNADFADPAVADKCQTVQYKVRLHNSGPGVVGAVNVKVALPDTVGTTNVSTATITGTNVQPVSISDNATLNLSTAQKVTYKAGSTELLDTNGNKLGSNLPDTITGAGVTIGDVRVSLNEIRYVQFMADIDCPVSETPPEVAAPPATTPPEVPPPISPPPVMPPPIGLVNVGAGSVFGLFAVVTALGVVAHHWYLGRRLSDGGTVDSS
ncbi:MAG: hypothetical protein JWO35_826 [Candidatus Saccharibacteria bacterium]|nr:hypothetical protein [Candidatus Saccharibacteria bacterium]